MRAAINAAATVSGARAALDLAVFMPSRRIEQAGNVGP